MYVNIVCDRSGRDEAGTEEEEESRHTIREDPSIVCVLTAVWLVFHPSCVLLFGTVHPCSNRRKTWFDQHEDPRVARDRLLDLVKAQYGKPLVIVGETRRMSYLSADDTYLCALDANLEGHRKATLEREMQVCVQIFTCVPCLFYLWGPLIASP